MHQPSRHATPCYAPPQFAHSTAGIGRELLKCRRHSRFSFVFFSLLSLLFFTAFLLSLRFSVSLLSLLNAKVPPARPFLRLLPRQTLPDRQAWRSVRGAAPRRNANVERQTRRDDTARLPSIHPMVESRRAQQQRFKQPAQNRRLRGNASPPSEPFHAYRGSQQEIGYGASTGSPLPPQVQRPLLTAISTPACTAAGITTAGCARRPSG